EVCPRATPAYRQRTKHGAGYRFCKGGRGMNGLEGITFANPNMFWLLLLLPLLPIWTFWRRKKQQGSLVVSSLGGLQPLKPAYPVLRHAGLVLRVLAAALLIIVLARPQSALSWEDSTTEGIDIVIATDI